MPPACPSTPLGVALRSTGRLAIAKSRAAARVAQAALYEIGLAVSDQAWEDLGIEPAALGELRDCEPMIEEFINRFERGPKNPEPIRAIQEKIALSQRRHRAQPRRYDKLADQMVWRIRVNQGGHSRRAAVWHDAGANVYWLCAVKKISDYPHPQEDKLYADLADLYASGKLLPTAEEIDANRAEQYWDTFVRCLAEARVRSKNASGEWHEASLNLPDETRFVAGYAYTEYEECYDGTFQTHTVLTVSEDAPGLTRPRDWKALIIEQCFENLDEEPMIRADGLPTAVPLQKGFVPFVQSAVTEPDETDWP